MCLISISLPECIHFMFEEVQKSWKPAWMHSTMGGLDGSGGGGRGVPVESKKRHSLLSLKLLCHMSPFKMSSYNMILFCF